MQINIYYMTGTNNSKRAAKLLELQLNSMNHQSKAINWLDHEFDGWDSADAFGFIAPVHSFREPTPFRKRIKALPKNSKSSKKPVFIISCCEGMPGQFYKRVAKQLKKKDINIIGVKTYYGPSNVLMWKKSFNRSQKDVDPEKDNSILLFAKKLPELIEKNERYKVKGNLFWGFIAAMVKNWNLRVMLKGGIKVDETKCNKCGKCAKNCMAQCISLDPFPIVNMKKCVVCLGCINLCPKDALDAENTKGKERFRGLGKIKTSPL
ncbi:MAG: EFR1 family ferrodoxin [Promethearchaeota archaeon]